MAALFNVTAVVEPNGRAAAGQRERSVRDHVRGPRARRQIGKCVAHPERRFPTTAGCRFHGDIEITPVGVAGRVAHPVRYQVLTRLRGRAREAARQRIEVQARHLGREAVRQCAFAAARHRQRQRLDGGAHRIGQIVRAGIQVQRCRPGIQSHPGAARPVLDTVHVFNASEGVPAGDRRLEIHAHLAMGPAVGLERQPPRVAADSIVPERGLHDGLHAVLHLRDA